MIRIQFITAYSRDAQRLFRRTILLACLVFIILAGLPTPVMAHPADMYFQKVTLTVGSEQLSADWHIQPGPLLAEALWKTADSSGDGKVSAEEANAWAAQTASLLQIQVDGQPLTCVLQKATWAPSLQSLWDQSADIALQATCVWAVTPAAGQVVQMTNSMNAANSTFWYAVNAAGGLAFHSPQQTQQELTFTLANSASGNGPDAGLTTWNSLSAALPLDQRAAQTISGLLPGATASAPDASNAGAPASDTPDAGAATPSSNRILAVFKGLNAQGPLPVHVVALAFLIAAALGVLHALSPGHGKALVAAYLLGQNVRVTQAVALALVITITHTGSVFLLGLITLWASNFFSPAQMAPVLEVISGTLIVLLGASLLWQRYRGWEIERRSRLRSRKAAATPVAVGSERVALKIHEPIQERGPAHTHPGPRFDPRSGGIPWRSLVLMGVSGGLVPCPDAIAILLVSIPIHQISLGLSVIAAFSLGLAVVLVSIGIGLVKVQHFFQRYRALQQVERYAPLVSAGVVLILGVSMTFTGFQQTVAAKTSTTGSGAARSAVLVQNVPVRALVMVGDAHQRSRLAVITPGKAADFLTGPEQDVVDYALDPSGGVVYYAIRRAGQGTDLYRLDLAKRTSQRILDCLGETCYRPFWSAAKQLLFYQREEPFDPDAQAYQQSTLWWFDPANSSTAPLFSESRFPVDSATLSADGRWLSYYLPGSTVMHMDQLQIKVSRSLMLPYQQAALWSQTGATLLFTDKLANINPTSWHLYRYDPQTDQRKDITPQLEGSSITSVAWSADGQKIAFVRYQDDGDPQTTDSTIWQVNADGSGLKQIFAQPGAGFANLSWTANGDTLVFSQVQVKDVQSPEAVIQLDLVSKKFNPVGQGENPILLP